MNTIFHLKISVPLQMATSVIPAPVCTRAHAQTNLAPTLAPVHPESLAGTVRSVSGRLVSSYKN